MSSFILFIDFTNFFFFSFAHNICIKIPFSHTRIFSHQPKPSQPPIWLIEYLTFSEFDYALRLFCYYTIQTAIDYFIKWLMKCWHFLTLNSIKMNQNRSEMRNQDLWAEFLFFLLICFHIYGNENQLKTWYTFGTQNRCDRAPLFICFQFSGVRITKY